MAKPSASILSGVTSFLGDFDQCLSLKSSEESSEEFKGQYCLLRPILPLPSLPRQYYGPSDESLLVETKWLDYLVNYNLHRYFSINPTLKVIEHLRLVGGRLFNVGICVPDTCPPDQLERSLNKRKFVAEHLTEVKTRFVAVLYPIIGIPLEIEPSSCWTQDGQNNEPEETPWLSSSSSGSPVSISSPATRSTSVPAGNNYQRYSQFAM